MKVTLYAIASGICLAFGLYALIGVWQAASLFSVSRAVANYRFWGPLAVLFLGAGLFFGYHALRVSLLQLKKSLHDDSS